MVIIRRWGAQNSTGLNRLDSIDYLKAIAILLVVITHTVSPEVNDMIGGPFWIDMAVPIFMILSGFTYSLSSDRHGISNFSQWFSWINLNNKLTRILLPYVITIAIETVTFTIFAQKSFIELLYGFFTGGWGPGSYYTPILIQLLVLFPMILLLFKKFPWLTVALSFGVHLGFDIVSNTLPVVNWLYRLMIFRYLAFIVSGIALYYYEVNILERKLVITMFALLSALYIWMCSYYGYIPWIFTKWNTTSLPTVFWAFGLVVLGFRYLNIESRFILARTFGTIGKASYHIFLTQMVYFVFGLGKYGVLMNIAICVIIGVVFYYLEKSLLNKAYIEINLNS